MTAKTLLRLGLVMCMLSLVACTDGGEHSSSTPSPAPSTTEPPPKPKAPRTGACYRLSLAGATSPTHGGKPVPCSSPHAAVTIHVGRLARVRAGTGTSARDQRRLTAYCSDQLRRFVRGTPEARSISRFQALWFRPTAHDAALGAAWFRCDLVALASSERLLRLPGGLGMRGVLDRPHALDTFGLCSTARPATAGAERVACALKHTWRAIGTIVIPGRGYPGPTAAREAGDDACATQVRAASGDALKYSYSWEWPTRTQWEGGQHYGFCWAPA